jgi:hypothetical protein
MLLDEDDADRERSEGRAYAEHVTGALILSALIDVMAAESADPALFRRSIADIARARVAGMHGHSAAYMDGFRSHATTLIGSIVEPIVRSGKVN